MSNLQEMLRLRVLLAFLKEDETCTVMGISRSLNETKQNISRTIIMLEQEGLIDRKDTRHPILTEYGRNIAKLYSQKMKIAMQFLNREGVSMENARKDACYWAIHNTEETMDIFRKCEEKNEVKRQMKSKSCFMGTAFIKNLKERVYHFPFFIHGGNDLTINKYFEHPCVCHVENGKGNILVRLLQSEKQKIKTIQYFDHGIFISAEKSGDILSFPVEILEFMNFGEGQGQVVYGTAYLKIQYECQGEKKEKSTMFTIIL